MSEISMLRKTYWPSLPVGHHRPTRESASFRGRRMSRASAAQVARLYGKRWSIETAFFEITTTLSCEINMLGYPKAALFTFCLALLAYNAVSLIKAALRSAHGRQKVNDEVSSYYLALEIGRTYDG